MVDDTELADRALAAYLGFACGDALGATVEFMSPKLIRRRIGVHRDITGGGWLALEAGQVTDDTQMALALGQALIDRQAWDLRAIADNFVAWLQSEPPDVGNTCRRGILRYRDTGILHGEPRDDEAGNGGCMRNLPVVLATLRQPQLMVDCSLQQCRLTHHHPLADSGTLAMAQMLRSLLLGGDGAACGRIAEDLIQSAPQFEFRPYPGKASAYIVDTLQTVLHYFFATDSFEDCLIETVNQGGDADTTGALAGMLAGAYYGLDAIPQRWLAALDAEVAGQIRRQTSALLALADNIGQT